MVMSFHFVPGLYPVDIISPLPIPQESTPPCSTNINISSLCFFNYHFDLKVTNVLNLDWENAEVEGLNQLELCYKELLNNEYRLESNTLVFFSLVANGLQIMWNAS